MKKLLSAICLVALMVGCASEKFSSQTKFDENPQIFQNPGQGWARFSQKMAGSKVNINYGVGYARYIWEVLEPKEGEYNWKPIDSAIEDFAKLGLPFYFRIMCVNTSGYPQKYATPKWVFDKGAKHTLLTLQKAPNKKYPDGKVEIVVPEFGDHVFIAAHEKFIKALAQRYDGDPRIGGLDLGSYGNWGEWHCTSLGLGKGVVRPHSPEIRRHYADMYLKNFKKTQIIFMTDDHETLEYALGKGEKPRVGMRRDGVGSPGHFKRWFGTSPYEKITRMADVWKDAPMFYEFYGTVEMMRDKGWDIPFSLEWVLKNHASIVNERPLTPIQIKDGTNEEKLLRNIDLYAGARLVPEATQIDYENGKLAVKIQGVNKGVAKIYLPYEFVYVLRDSSGKIISETVSASNPRNILPGKFEIADTFNLPLEADKKYTLSLRVRNIDKVLKDFRFASKNLDKDGALILGDISF